MSYQGSIYSSDNEILSFGEKNNILEQILPFGTESAIEKMHKVYYSGFKIIKQYSI